MVKGLYLFLLLLFSISMTTHAANNFRLMAKSSTGRTAIFNIGKLDGLKDNDVVVLLKNAKPELSDFDSKSMMIVAQAKVIKVLDTRSVWFLYKIFEKEQLNIDERFVLTTQENLLKGRAEPKIKRKKIIDHTGNQAKNIKDYYRGFDQDRLVKKEDDYIITSRLFKTNPELDRDFELLDLGEWNTSNSDYYAMLEREVVTGRTFDAKTIYTSPYQDDFWKQKRLDTYEKMMVNYLLKVNNPNFSYDKLYYARKTDPDFPNLAGFGTDQSSSALAREKREKRESEARELNESLFRKGEDWSDEYSDEDLTRLIYDKGVLSEQHRRQVILARRYARILHLNLGLNLANNETPADITNRQEVKNSIGASLEYNLAKRYPKMERFSAEAEFRIANDGVGVSQVNASIYELSLAGHLNWYPFLPPNSIEENLFFVGAGMRWGRARLSIENLGEQGLYAVSSLPILRLGVKYNFRNNFAVRLVSSYEQINLARIERNFVNFLPENVTTTDIRFGISVAYFF